MTPNFPQTPLEWLKVFGPGAVLASLTIGVGELVFSTRAGALFGYNLLWFFALVLFFKWLLVYSTARHMSLTGAHPFRRWMELPGPRGWFPLIFLLLAVLSFPIWVAFHSGTIGSLLAALTGTQGVYGEGGHFVWGIGMLGLVTILCFIGGYKTLERAQIAIVAVMLLSVLAAFFMMQPDWGELLNGLFIPKSVNYPNWAKALPEIRTRPVWVETVTYVGIIGGSAYDYLAYVSYVREKGWIAAGGEWLRPILFDSILSFVAVLIFTVVFTVCGALILQPQHQIPAGTDLLTLQSQFLTPLFPALKYLYFVGAFLAVFGTLYGTIEVAPAILRELAEAFGLVVSGKVRNIAVGWVCLVALLVLIASLAKKGAPPALIVILTPANLFTGVLACGCVCLLSVWADFKFLQPELRMPLVLVVLNVLGGALFVLLGLKGYWDYNSAYSGIIFTGTLLVGVGGAVLLGRKFKF